MKPQRTFNRAMLKATCLTGMGRLVDATKLIQRAVIGLSRSLIPGAGASAANESTIKASHKAEPAAAGRFSQQQFEFAGQSYAYRLFVPEPAKSNKNQPLPLVVMLHGCKQDALDFSHGTAMNQLASAQHCIVLYPEQLTAANSGRCWNWFEPEHQQRGQGEPGMIAALTLHILATQGVKDANACQPDPTRVYIAGLSAGGAMASVVAGLYPEIFAALGVHSGLPAGAANNLMTAFGAMQRATPAVQAEVAALPTIVFHGSADSTVHPDNSEQITAAAQAAFTQAGTTLSVQASQAGSPERAALRTVYSAADGTPQVERWQIEAGAHAWSGGDAAGSYTDPQGPSASAAMLTFFLSHRLKT